MSEIQINDHPFYQDPRFLTEKRILEKLTEICGFETSIGTKSYFPCSPVIDIGFILDQSKKEKEGSIPFFKEGSKITIFLNGGRHQNPLNIPKDLSFEATRKILVPLVQNWVKVVTFLIEYYGTLVDSCEEEDANAANLKKSCFESLKDWKKEFGS